MQRPGKLLAGTALALLTAACDREPRPPAPDAPLAALVSGCDALVREPGGDGGAGAPSCVLPKDGRVRLFVPSAGGDRVTFTAGGPLGPPPPRDVPGGRLFTIAVPQGAREVKVRLARPDGSHASYMLRIASASVPGWLRDAEARRKRGDLAGAVAAATPKVSSPSTRDRAAAEGVLARVALRRGEIDEAARHFRAAIDLDARAGRVSARADDAFALVFLLHQRAHRYGEARRVLDELAGALAPYPDGQAREPLYRGQLAWETGDTRTALRELALAQARATRIGAASIARAAREVHAMVLCSAGSGRTCLTELRAADRELEHAKGVTACERADVLISLGFAELIRAETSRREPLTDLGASDRRALTLLDGPCPDAYLRAIAREHLALASVLRGDPARAREHLAKAKQDAPEPRATDALFWLDVEGRIALAEKKYATALARFGDEEQLGAAAARRDEVWHGLVGRGRVLEAKRDRRGALAAYLKAERVLDQAVPAIPFGEGRSSVAAESGESMRRAARILLALGRDHEALDVVRRARARAFATLSRAERVASLRGEARERWERAVSEYRKAREALDAAAAKDWAKSREALEAARVSRKKQMAALRARLDDAMAIVGGARPTALAPLAEDEIALAYADLGDGVVGFVARPSGVRSFSVKLDAKAPPDALAEALLEPASRELDGAARVRVLAGGPIAGVDVHALPWRGAPLVAHAPVVYGLDVGAVTATSRGERRALVVADPTGDLPSARTEGEAALEALRRGYQARALMGHDATAERVREALPRIALLHYAGHGVFAGREGAASALPLAGGGALTIGDVLASPSVPARVVLSGCEAGRARGAAEEAAASLAHAFVLAGAREVVAPVRVVDDRAAGELARALYADADAGPEPDLAAALRRAQVDAWRRGAKDWQAFRVFSP